MGDGDDVREQSAPDVEAFQLVQIVIRPDRSELEDLIKGCFSACGLGVVEHVGHDHLPRIIPVESINWPDPGMSPPTKLDLGPTEVHSKG